MVPCHIVTVIVFVILGGIGASLNHTRFDVIVPYIYDVKAHDVHHRLITANYGQYTMFWDKAMGTYREFTVDEKRIRVEDKNKNE